MFLGVADVPESFACSCVQATFMQHAEYADAILVGTSDSFEGDDMTHYWSFTDVVFVKGEPLDEIVPTLIATPSAGSACGYGFEGGIEYVVFAIYDEGRLHTSLCNGNLETSELSESQIKILSLLQTSSVDFEDGGAGMGDGGDLVSTRTCGESEIELGGCIGMELIAALVIVAAGAAGLVVWRRLRK